MKTYYKFIDKSAHERRKPVSIWQSYWGLEHMMASFSTRSTAYSFVHMYQRRRGNWRQIAWSRSEYDDRSRG